MTVQSPPYALQNSAHTAALFRQASTSLIATTGVGGPAELQVNATSGMTVAVAAGRAWIPGTSVTGVAGQKFSVQGDAINVSSLAGTLQTIDIMSQWNAGTAPLRADIYTTVAIQVTFT